MSLSEDADPSEQRAAARPAAGPLGGRRGDDAIGAGEWGERDVGSQRHIVGVAADGRVVVAMLEFRSIE